MNHTAHHWHTATDNTHRAHHTQHMGHTSGVPTTHPEATTESFPPIHSNPPLPPTFFSSSLYWFSVSAGCGVRYDCDGTPLADPDVLSPFLTPEPLRLISPLGDSTGVPTCDLPLDPPER